MALANDGTVYTWGANINGDLGNNSTTGSFVPVAVSTFGALSGKTVVGISAASGYALALASDGTVYGWGTGNSASWATAARAIARCRWPYRPGRAAP